MVRTGSIIPGADRPYSRRLSSSSACTGPRPDVLSGDEARRRLRLDSEGVRRAHYIRKECVDHEAAYRPYAILGRTLYHAPRSVASALR